MEDLAFSTDSLLSFLPSWDRESHQFSSNGDGVPVRHVQERKIPAVKPRGYITSSKNQRQKHENEKDNNEKMDLFTGVIDGVTGEILHGTRRYAWTGEVYEGPFVDGVRHGKEAIVRDVFMPSLQYSREQQQQQQESTSGDGFLQGMMSPQQFLHFTRANFFGSYENDQPLEGTLVTDRFTYKGPFKNHLLHGDKGELVHSSGYIYRGEFFNGAPHGMGVETDPDRGEYQGEFRNGVRCGTGTYKEILPGAIKDEDILFEERCKKWQEEEDSKVKQKEGKELRQQKIDNFVWDWESRGSSVDGEEDRDIAKLEKILNEEVDRKGEFDNNKKSPQSQTQSTQVPKWYTYSGSYESNLRQGEGTEWTTDGEIYTGQFLADRRHGLGSLQNVTTGITYEGQWRSGKPSTDNGWRIFYPSNDVYVGHAENLSPNGHGIYKHANGDVYSGEWKDGKRNGKGVKTTQRGVEFIGEWKDDVLVMMKGFDEIDRTIRRTTKTLEVADNDIQGGDNLAKMAISVENSLKMVETGTNKIGDSKTNKCDAFADSQGKVEGLEEEEKSELHTYPNGDTFMGKLENNQRNGYGVYVSHQTKCTYTGEFKNNLRHGYGILVRPGHGKYAGGFKSDHKHGVGTLILDDTSCYHGGFVHGGFEGIGTLCEQDGTVYVGDWEGGLRHGAGVETYSDGKAYHGEFKCGKRDGEGTLLERSGGKIMYTGEWCDGKYHGEGICTEREGDEPAYRAAGNLEGNGGTTRFEGGFVSGRRHGYGTLSSEEDGMIWKGVWNQGDPVSGKWRVTYNDGGIYSGHAFAVDGKTTRARNLKKSAPHILVVPNGFGNMKYGDGDVYVGNFVKGKRSGEGMCLFSCGDKWEGLWKNDQIDKNNRGVLTMQNGTVHEL